MQESSTRICYTPSQGKRSNSTSPRSMNVPTATELATEQQEAPPQRSVEVADDGQSRTEQASTPRYDSEDNDWDKEFRDHFYLAADLFIAEYFRYYVPSADDGGMPPENELPDAFKSLEQPIENEKDMYDPLVKGLTSLVEDFPDHLRPVFGDTSKAIFEPSHFSQCRPSPDICSSYPGIKQIEKGSYNSAATIWEVHHQESADPVRSSGILKRRKGTRLVGVRIANRNMRIFRFDHARVIASVRLDYVESPEIVRKFLWRLVHPAHKLPGTVVGWDPTMRRPTSKELEAMYARLVCVLGAQAPPKETFERNAMWMTACIKREGNNDERAPKVIIPNGHRFTRSPLKIDRFQGIEVECLTFKLLYRSLTLFGRATTVYEVLIDHSQFADKT